MTSRRSGRPPERAGGDALAALRLVTAALADRKALDPMVLDLRGLTAAADYFVIVSGTSDAHVRGMAEHLMEALAPRGVVPHHVEGLTQGRWVLLDYVDFVVHVFHPELREFYQLERLCGDVPGLAAGTPDSGFEGLRSNDGSPGADARRRRFGGARSASGEDGGDTAGGRAV